MIKIALGCVLVATLVAVGIAPAAPVALLHGNTAGLSPCPGPPSRYKPVPFDSLSWNWEIGQWAAACGLGLGEGPRKVAAQMHFSTGDQRAVATHYVTFYVTSVLPKVASSKAIADRIGVTRVEKLMGDGMLAGFGLRGRP
jgi:hypothetical protein